jgi:hypothetical protein
MMPAGNYEDHPEQVSDDLGQIEDQLAKLHPTDRHNVFTAAGEFYGDVTAAGISTTGGAVFRAAFRRALSALLDR